MDPGKSTMLQWKATPLRKYDQHKLDLIGGEKRGTQNWVDRKGKKGEYDQNKL